ncbi:MAG: VanZ family protein [Faecalibacterium sp.]|nr:VanZ family protein [Faecalibacterium sp.]
MEVYLIPISAALLWFPVLAAVITLPFALYEYHKYGSLPWLRTLVVYTFIFYMLAAYFLIILPLPDGSDPTLFSFARHFEPIPFNNLAEYVEKSGMPASASAVFAFFKSPTFLQLAFNVLMTVPFGVYLRYYFKRSFLQTLLLSFGLSLFYELTQITALYGIYPAPYRTFDADDLICNTLGGVIGFLVAPGLLFFLPRREAIDESAVRGSRRVTLVRRMCGTIVDAFLVGMAAAAIEVVAMLLSPHDTPFVSFFLLHLPSIFFVFQWACAVISHGYTPGKRLCHLRIADENGQPPTFRRLTLRYVLIWCQLCGTQIFAINSGALNDYFMGGTKFVLFFAVLAAEVFWFSFFFEMVRKFFSKESGRPFWYERMSKTHSVSVFPVPDSEATT